MCGIVGIINRDEDSPCNQQNLIAMRDLQAHRGPDDSGLFAKDHIGLGHRRLSIIDISSGQQPMTNEDRTLWIVFNGEIYNYRELRSELRNRGHIFRTESDTETILHLYEEEAENCVNKLNGMFAFAIWNDRDKSLFLARDRIGIKPLYYALAKKSFLFASEIKSLFVDDMVPAQINEDAIAEYFTFRDIGGEATLFRGVKTLQPGHFLKFSKDQVEISQYWSPFPHNRVFGMRENDAVAELESLLLDSVRIRLMSDVPLGTLCSGGIDSSLVTAIAAGYAGENLNTFSVGFHESDYDETDFAQTVSRKYATKHHEARLSGVEYAELLPEMIWQNDLPLNFANSIQIYAISKLAKDFVTVVLTGEGADELFGGYPRYHIPKLALRYQNAPKIVQKMISLGTKYFQEHRIEKVLSYKDSSLEDLSNLQLQLSQG